MKTKEKEGKIKMFYFIFEWVQFEIILENFPMSYIVKTDDLKQVIKWISTYNH